MNKVCHLTSAHPRFDTRIFIKECLSLARAGFDVSLIVADGDGDEEASGVQIIDIGERSGGRLRRVLTSFWPMFRAARALKADLYHFHDPELIPAGILLRLFGSKVIFDVHENFPAQVQSKPFIPYPLKPVATFLARGLEFFAAQCFNGYVAVNNEIASHFPKALTIKVHNFPVLSEIAGKAIPYDERPNEIVFIGNCSEARGLRQMIGAVNKLPDNLKVRLYVAGPVFPKDLPAQLESTVDMTRVTILGWQTRQQIRERLSNARIGLVLFHPEPNHINAMPNKLFDYMGARLPLIASDFPQWSKIVDETGCGVVVDPLSEEAIAVGIEDLLRDQVRAEDMGQRGFRAATELYNWDTEAARLIELYNTVMAGHL